MKNNNKLSFTAANTYPVKLIGNNDLMRDGHIVPLHIQFIPTNRCNQNCHWCSCSKVDRQIEMPIDEIKRLARYFSSLGTQAVTITGGGEPTIHRQWEDVLDSFYNNRIKIGITTNGIEWYKSKNLYFENEVVTWARISMADMPLRNDPNFLLDISGKLPKVDIGVSWVVDENINIDNAKKICKMVDELSNVTHIRYVQDILNPLDENMQQLQNAVENITSKAIFQYRSNFTNGTSNCYISKLKPLIDATGYIYPCCGVQYATNDICRLPEKFKMCHWTQFNECDKFDGSICKKCFYNNYNEFLQLALCQTQHQEFV